MYVCLYKKCDKVPFSFLWMCSCYNTIYWKDYIFSTEIPLNIHQKWSFYDFLFCSIDLCLSFQWNCNVLIIWFLAMLWSTIALLIFYLLVYELLRENFWSFKLKLWVCLFSDLSYISLRSLSRTWLKQLTHTNTSNVDFLWPVNSISLTLFIQSENLLCIWCF